MFAIDLVCSKCRMHYPLETRYLCKSCGGILEVRYDYEELADQLKVKNDLKSKALGIWKYEKFLPVERIHAVSLLEGDTPLVACERLAEKMGLKNLYIKNEGRNPTGSFKDRSVSLGISHAMKIKASTVYTASTGNAGASVAAYSSKAGLKAFILIDPEIPRNKLLQLSVYNPEVIAFQGLFKSYKRLFHILKSIDKKFNWYNLFLWALVNPLVIEGIKTIAYEIMEQVDWKVPDLIVVPVGGGDCLAAIYRGFKELKEEIGFISSMPRMVGVQAENAAPLVKAFKEKLEEVPPIKNPHTVASGINVAFSGSHALKAIKESRGLAISVPDKEIIKAQSEVAKLEGIFIEVTSASVIAAVKTLIEEKILDKNEHVLCIITSTGLKDIGHFKKIVRVPKVAKSLNDLFLCISRNS